MDYIRIKDIDVYHSVVGEGRPIIFLHGNPADHRSMMSAFEPIVENRPAWKRVYLDLPGMGKTSGADWMNGSDHMLEIIMAFIDEVIPGERFLVVGESFGGYMAQGLAHHRSNLIDGMFLIAPVVQSDPSMRRLPETRIIHVERTFVESLPSELQEALRQVSTVHTREISERLLADYITAMQMSDQAFLRRIRENYAFSFDLNDPMPRYEFPALVITGKHDTIAGYADQLELHGIFPRGTHVVLDRAGHVIELEQPALFNALAGEWLDRVEEYLSTRHDTV